MKRVSKEIIQATEKDLLQEKIHDFLIFNIYVKKNFGDQPLLIKNKKNIPLQHSHIDKLSQEWSEMLISSIPSELILFLNFSYDIQQFPSLPLYIDYHISTVFYKEILNVFKKLILLMYASIKFRRSNYVYLSPGIAKKSFYITMEEGIYLKNVIESELIPSFHCKKLIPIISKMVSYNILIDPNKSLEEDEYNIAHDCIEELSLYIYYLLLYHFQSMYPLIKDDFDITAISPKYKFLSGSYDFVEKTEMSYVDQTNYYVNQYGNVYSDIFNIIDLIFTNFLRIAVSTNYEDSFFRFAATRYNFGSVEEFDYSPFILLVLYQKYLSVPIYVKKLKGKFGLAVRPFYTNENRCYVDNFIQILFFYEPIRLAILSYNGQKNEILELQHAFLQLVQQDRKPSYELSYLIAKYKMNSFNNLDHLRIILPEVINDLHFKSIFSFYALECCKIPLHLQLSYQYEENPNILMIYFKNEGDEFDYPLQIDLRQNLFTYELYCISTVITCKPQLYIRGAWTFNDPSLTWMKCSPAMSPIVKRDVDEELNELKNNMIFFIYIYRPSYKLFNWRF